MPIRRTTRSTILTRPCKPAATTALPLESIAPQPAQKPCRKRSTNPIDPLLRVETPAPRNIDTREQACRRPLPLVGWVALLATATNIQTPGQVVATTKAKVLTLVVVWKVALVTAAIPAFQWTIQALNNTRRRNCQGPLLKRPQPRKGRGCQFATVSPAICQD